VRPTACLWLASACLTGGLSSFAAAPATATTLVLRGGKVRPQPYQRWVDQAKIPTPRGIIRLDLTEYGCAGYVCAYPTEQPPRIVLFFDSFDRYTRYDTLHEVGHVFAAERGDGAFRRAFRHILGRWDEEWFAQAYSWCAVNPRAPARWRYPGYGYWPTARQHRRVCSLIRRRGAGGHRATRLAAPPLPHTLLQDPSHFCHHRPIWTHPELLFDHSCWSQ
jgi:hypothetical protein